MLTLYICSRGAESATLVGRGGEKLGEGRAGAPGDQALLQRDLGLLQKGPPSEMEGGRFGMEGGFLLLDYFGGLHGAVGHAGYLDEDALLRRGYAYAGKIVVFG